MYFSLCFVKPTLRSLGCHRGLIAMLALFARQPYEDNVCQLVACNRLKGPYRVCRSVGKKKPYLSCVYTPYFHTTAKTNGASRSSPAPPTTRTHSNPNSGFSHLAVTSRILKSNPRSIHKFRGAQNPPPLLPSLVRIFL